MDSKLTTDELGQIIARSTAATPGPWQAFVEGERHYQSLEGQFEITCTSDDLGQVSCVLTVGQPWPQVWKLQAELTIGGGSHVAQFAADLGGVQG